MSDLDIGILNSNQNYLGLVDSNDPFNLYKFSLNSPGKVGVSLTGLSANADLQILDNSEKVLYSSASSDTSNEVIAIDNLAAGNYTIRVNQVSGKTNYNLSLTSEEIEKPQVDAITGLDIESGYFIVGETGQVGVNFINDGGKYKGELAIFSLEGIDNFIPGSIEFIKEAANRALSNSNLGYIVISDSKEGAKFNVGLANVDNDGEYKGVKTFAMKPGDTFGVMLVPNGKVEEVFNKPDINGNKRPLFSLVTANPTEAFHLGQVADINGMGSAFAIEDQRVDKGTDKDYNDVIFQLTGAMGKAVNLDEVINPENDWRDSNLGKDLIDYVHKEELAIDPNPPIDTIPVDPNPTIDNTPVDPNPPIDNTPVDPSPPIDNTPVDPSPPIDTTPQIDRNQALIGVIDTGFSGNNPDLDYRRFLLGSDRISQDNNPLLSPGEGSEHGTHILGLIAATQGNGIGIDGINDKAPIWLGRAVGSGNWADSLIEFVDAAKQSGQKNAIVNLSLDLTQINQDGSVTTRYELTPKEREAIEYARQNHVLIVTAAGNDGGVMSVLGQASQEFDNIITVGASDGSDRANYSSYGAGLDILTEGGTIYKPVLSTVKDDVGMIVGTSAAAAKATGVASLVWAANPDLNFKQVIQILESTATDLKTSGWDGETGFGLLNSAAAVELAKNTVGENYTPEPWVTPFTWDGEGKVTPSDRAASGGNTLATAAVQPDPNFSDSDIVDVNNREKYYEVTIEQPGYLRYTVTRTNGTEWLPSVTWLRTDGKPVSRQFSFAPTDILGGAAGGGGDSNSTSMTRGIFVDPGTYYLKTSLVDSYQSPEFWLDPPVQYTTVQNYNLSSAFIPDLPATFSGAAQFKTPNGQRVSELNISSQVNYDPANPDSAKVQYWLDVSEPGNLTLKIGSSADKIGLLAKKIIGQGDANSDGQILFSSGAIRPDQAQSLQLLNLNKGRYLLEVYPRRGSNSQPFVQPFTINGVFSRLAPNPGEGQVPSNAGGFSKTVTSNGVDTHYYANGYLSVQPSGYATWYTYGAGVPLPTIPGATVPSGTVPGNSVFGLGSPLALPKNNSAPSGIALFAPVVYKLGETVSFTQANTSVYDPDGVSDLSKLEFWLKVEGGNWEYKGAVRNFVPDIIDDTQGSFNYGLNNLAGGKYQLQMKLTDWSGASKNEYWSFTVVEPNKAPENLQFNLTKSSYSVGETVRLDAKVFDINSATDISKVEFYYKQNGSNWQYLGKNESFIPDGNWANFYLNITDAPAANYEVMATAYDRAGLASNTVTGAFQVTAPFDINASRWFPGEKILSGEMLAEYDRLVAQGNYLGNPSFVDTSPAKSYFGTDVQRAFFPSQYLGYTSIWKSQYGTFSLSGAIADYYTNYYFRKYGDDISRRNPSLPDGVFHIYSGLGVPISPIYKQANGSEVAYFEGGTLTNWNGVVTPNYNQNAKYFELVGQGAPNGELQWKNDYSYWDWKSVGQPTGPVRRINNGWIQEFTGSIDNAGDSIFLLKDGQSVEGGNDLNNIPNGGPYRVQGGFLNAYRSVGGYERQNGGLGFPTMSQLRSNFNGYELYQAFENGFIAKTYDGRTVIRNWQGQDIWPEISANHWNARFINRNQWNVNDYNSYDFSNPAAVADLGEQKQGNGLIGLHKDFGEGSPANGVQNDYFAMLAWTRTYLEAGKTYKITTQSDDGTWFMLKKAGTNNWITNLAQGNDGGDWRDRSATEPAKTIQFKVNESGEYDFHVQYYDRTGFSTINVNLEEIQPFPTNPQPQTSIWSEKVNGVLDGLNGEFQIRDPYGNWPGQCVSFVKRFTQSLGVNMNPMGGDGGARNGFINFNKPGLSLSSAQADKIVFTGNEQPQVGDIIFFDQTSSNPYGHVAVVQSVLGDGRVIIEQSNGDNKALSTGTYVTRDEINLNANPPRRGLGPVMGWLRLKNSQSVSSGSGSSSGGFASGGGNPIGGGSPSGGGNPIGSGSPSGGGDPGNISNWRYVKAEAGKYDNGNFRVGLLPFDNWGNFPNNPGDRTFTGYINPNARNTWVISHGFQDNPYEAWKIKNLANGLREIIKGDNGYSNPMITKDDQVLVVDWGEGSKIKDDESDYWTGASRVDDVGAAVADILKSAGVKPETVNFIGHSLGAYVSAYAAQTLGQVNILTLLDPATEFNPWTAYQETIPTLQNAPRFDSVSKFSTQFGSTTKFGTERTTADESYWVDFAGVNFNYEHGEVVTWFIENLRRPNTSPYGTMQSFDMLTNTPRTSKLNLNMNYNDRNGWEATIISERRTDGWWTSRNEIWQGKVDRSEVPNVAYG